MASDGASVQMLAADDTSLKLLAWTNFHPDSAAFWQRVEVGAGSTCSKALGDNERVVVADVEACEFMAGTADQQEYRRSGIRARAIDAAAFANRPASRHALDALAGAAYADRR